MVSCELDWGVSLQMKIFVFFLIFSISHVFAFENKERKVRIYDKYGRHTTTIYGDKLYDRYGKYLGKIENKNYYDKFGKKKYDYFKKSIQ